MKIRRTRVPTAVLAGLMSLAALPLVRAQAPAAPDTAWGAQEAEQNADGPLVRVVRQATEPFRDVRAAEAAGYARSSGCVSGPEQGAMGIHYGNGALVGDGLLEASRPEVMVYEPRNDGSLQLVAAEYVVLAEQWDAANEHPPVLHGQHFHYVAAPNRAGLPAHYELHVWAWKQNPHGTFADWNPRVRCNAYAPGGQ